MADQEVARPVIVEERIPVPFTIQIFYEARDAKDRVIRAVSVWHTMAINVGEAYTLADAVFKSRADVTFGAALPGHHLRFP